MGHQQLTSSLKRGRQEIPLSSQFTSCYVRALKISLVTPTCFFQEIFSKLNYGIKYCSSVLPLGTYIMLESLFRSGENLKYFHHSCISCVTAP